MPRPKNLTLCKEIGCSTLTVALGWCDKHYRRWKRNGNQELKRIEGGNPIGYLTKQGYMRHIRGGFVHRKVMESVLGRPLLPFPQEIVHHKNNVRSDNRPENLELLSNSAHSVLTHKPCVDVTCTKFHKIVRYHG